MKIVKIIGGLGNQMFQYAFYLALKNKYPGEDIRVDLSLFDSYKLHNGYELDRVFGLHPAVASADDVRQLSRYFSSYLLQRINRKLLPVRPTECIERKDFLYQETVWLEGDRYYEGYWQNPAYFRLVDAEVRQAFAFDRFCSEQNRQLAETLVSGRVSVGIHVRRGDYVKHKIFGGICEEAYYQQAIRYILDRFESPFFYIFSNDFSWCQTHLLPLLGENFRMVDWNKEKDSYADMQLMSLCRVQVIANSSFSWWSGYLNIRPDKMIIAPARWANLAYPVAVQLADWVLIQT